MWLSPARGPVPYGVMQAASFALAALTSYALNSRFTWRDRVPRPIPFAVVTLASAGLSAATVSAVTGLASAFGAGPLAALVWAKLLAAGVSAASNFLGYHLWAFRARPEVEIWAPALAAPALSLVLPAYREARRLPATLAALDGWLSGSGRRVEVWVADDGSDDGTADLVLEARALRDWLGLVRLGSHRGKGGALREAYLRARAGRVVYTDADLSFDLGDVERVAEALDLADVAVAVRTVGRPASRLRRLVHRAFPLVLAALGLAEVPDPQCGLKGYRRGALRELVRVCRMDGFGFDAETLVAARAKGLRVRTVPIGRWNDRPGSTVRPLWHGLETAQALLVLAARRWAGAYGPAPELARARLLAVALAVASFAGLFAIKVWQWHAWLISAFDGGLYFQSLWLVGHGLWNAWNAYASQPVLADANQWLIVPLGYLARLGGPYMAMAVQAAAGAALLLAAATYARMRGLPPGLALLAGVAVLVHPASFGTQALDWHPDPVGVAAFAWAIVWAGAGRPWPAAVALLLALLTKNQAVVPVAGLGLAWLVRGGLHRRPREALAGAGLAVLAGAFLLANEQATVLLGGANLNVAADYRSLGGSIPAVVASLARDPALLWAAVGRHANYWLTMLVPFLGLPVLSPISALPGFAVLAVNSLADNPSLTVAYDQYALWALPSLAFAALDTVAAGAQLLARLGGDAAPWARRAKAGAVLALALASALFFFRFTLANEAWRLNPLPAHDDLVAAARRIPDEAAVMGDPGTAAALSWRRWSGAFPFTHVDEFLARVPRGTPVYVFLAPGRAFGGIAVDSERRWLAELMTSGAEPVVVRNGVVVLRLR